MTRIRWALMQDLVHLVCDEKDREASCGEPIDDLKNSGFCTDVDANVGRIQDARIRRQPFGQHNALLVAAGELLDRPVCRVGLDA